MNSPLITSTCLVAVLAWVIALIVDPGPLTPTSTVLVGVGLVAMATVSTVGLVLSGGRWARRLAFVTLGAAIAVAVIRPIDVLWVVALALTALAFGSLFLPGITDGVRKLPSASGPPPRAVITPLMLIASPFLIGLFGSEAAPWAMITVSLTALAAAFLYSQALPGCIVTIRVVWPAIAIGLAPFMGLPGGIVSALLGIAVAVLAWHPSVKTAAYPPYESATTYSIPPELTPTEILDAADIDDTGSPR